MQTLLLPHYSSDQLRCLFLFVSFNIHVQQRNHQSHSEKKYIYIKFHSWICSSQVKDLDLEGLFANIESVLETSQKLLKNLEDAVKDKEGKDQELGNVWAWVMIIDLAYTNTFF